MATTQTVSFNVGGKLYEVTRSLLDQFPDSMLARSASEQWKPDGGRPIFIERDSEQFRFCLQFMRDGTVDLPLTVSKNAILGDLEFYGICCDDETQIAGVGFPRRSCIADQDESKTKNDDGVAQWFAVQIFGKACVGLSANSVSVEVSDKDLPHSWKLRLKLD